MSLKQSKTTLNMKLILHRRGKNNFIPIVLYSILIESINYQSMKSGKIM